MVITDSCRMSAWHTGKDFGWSSGVKRCIIISLSGLILGREALGWFVDMSAIGASIGYFFTCASALVTMKRDGDGTVFLKTMATIGVVFYVKQMKK